MPRIGSVTDRHANFGGFHLRTTYHLLGSAAVVALAASPAAAAGTRAGTQIANTATATYDGPGGTPTSISSNTVTVRVDEILNVSVTSTDPGDVPARPGQTDAPLGFRVTNAGNGPEAFTLAGLGALGGDDFDPNVTAIYIDNGNGVYDPGVDTRYIAGTNDPLLQPDTGVTVFVLSTIPGAATNGQRGLAQLTATAVTGSGAPGTAFAGQGDGGGDAVVGTTGAQAKDDGAYAIQAVTVAFSKAASVLDPFGGSRSVPGSIITYSLQATLSGSGSLPNLGISDPIPAGTTFQSGSLTLNGAALTDAADADAGRFSAGAISVALGSPAAGTSHLVTFKVRID